MSATRALPVARPAGARRVLFREHAVEREEEKRPGGAAGGLESLGALGAEEGVGVVAGWERRDAEPEPAPRERVRAPGQRPPLRVGRALEEVLGAPRRLLTRAVGVEEEDGLVGVAAQEPELLRRERGAEDRHRLPEAVLVRHQAVDVALDQERAPRLRHALARAMEGVEGLPLQVERGLRGVQVLRLLAGASTN